MQIFKETSYLNESKHIFIQITVTLQNISGTLRDWWAKETAEQFVEKAQCVVDQFGNFTVEQVGLNINGINTQGENIADMGGILPAYEGYGEFDTLYCVTGL